MKINIVQYSEVKKHYRMDAEFFYTKFDILTKRLRSYQHGFDTFRRLVKVNDKKHEPKSKQTYKYIELANIADGRIIGSTEDEGQNLPTRARKKVKKGDVIVSSIEGSLESTALVGNEYDGALCSTGFHVLNFDDESPINAETMLVFLQSEIGMQLLKRGCTGTILTAISRDELCRIELPKVDKETQTKIKKKIEESIKLIREAKEKYEEAKSILTEEIG